MFESPITLQYKRSFRQKTQTEEKEKLNPEFRLQSGCNQRDLIARKQTLAGCMSGTKYTRFDAFIKRIQKIPEHTFVLIKMSGQNKKKKCFSFGS